MKKLSGFNKFIFFLNSIAAVLLLLAFILPYISPKSFPTLSILSLLVSPLLFANVLFAVYWAIKLKKQFMLSGLMIALSLLQFNSFYVTGSDVSEENYKHNLSVMSYNVLLFNSYGKGDYKASMKTFEELLETYQPDVLSMQEYSDVNTPVIKGYPYKYVHFKQKSPVNGVTKKYYLGHAIYSKYPIVNEGAFDFKKTVNNTLYADIVKDKDTIRIYNLHLKSFGISPSVSSLQEGDKKKLIGRMADAFKEQASQVEAILEHKNKSPYPAIITGDFNNTAFSYIYNQLNHGMTDSFSVCGSGLGTTFDFDGFPLRIDYILAQDTFNVLSFETIEKTFSDHHPIIAKLGWD